MLGTETSDDTMKLIWSQTGLKYMGDQDFYIDSVMVVMKGQYMELERVLTIFTALIYQIICLKENIWKSLENCILSKGLTFRTMQSLVSFHDPLVI